MNIGEKVLALRELHDWTLAQVSKLTGISLSHLSAIENGTRKNPSFAMIAKIARAYQVPLTYFEDQPTTYPINSMTSDTTGNVALNGIENTYDDASSASYTYSFKQASFLEDADTRAFLSSEQAPRYIAFAKQLAERTPEADTSTLLQLIAEFLNDQKSYYNHTNL